MCSVSYGNLSIAMSTSYTVEAISYSSSYFTLCGFFFFLHVNYRVSVAWSVSNRLQGIDTVEITAISVPLHLIPTFPLIGINEDIQQVCDVVFFFSLCYFVRFDEISFWESLANSSQSRIFNRGWRYTYRTIYFLLIGCISVIPGGFNERDSAHREQCTRQLGLSAKKITIFWLVLSLFFHVFFLYFVFHLWFLVLQK